MKSERQVALVTGASTGLGKSVSIELAKHGYKIILVSRNKNKLNRTASLIKNNGNDSKIIVADITDENSVKKLFLKLKDYNIDVLINNAGLGIFNKIQNISIKEWDQQMNTNLKGSFLITKNIVSKMIDRKAGRIVFINSVAGLNPYPYSSVYVASKYGLRGFASSLREELREHNIKVLSIYPGAINTPFWENIKVDFSKDKMLSSDDVAASIVSAICAPNNLVQEEIVIRRTEGDF